MVNYQKINETLCSTKWNTKVTDFGCNLHACKAAVTSGSFRVFP